MAGYVDLHCHLLPGVDDGARTPEDALEMARALVDLGFNAVAPSPHARPEFASAEACAEARATLETALAKAAIPLRLYSNAEHALVLDGFLEGLGTPASRPVNGGRYVLVEAPYQAPVPALPDLVFRMVRRGVIPCLPTRSAARNSSGRGVPPKWCALEPGCSWTWGRSSTAMGPRLGGWPGTFWRRGFTP